MRLIKKPSDSVLRKRLTQVHGFTPPDGWEWAIKLLRGGRLHFAATNKRGEKWGQFLAVKVHL